jgi:hypothetical protein
VISGFFHAPEKFVWLQHKNFSTGFENLKITVVPVFWEEINRNV